MTGLTPRQHDCLTAIERLGKTGVAPSIGDLKDELGISSRSEVHRIVLQLEERGHITRTPHRARSIEVVRKRPPTPAELNRFGTPELLDLLAHVCGILGHRLGPAKVRETLDRIGARLAGVR